MEYDLEEEDDKEDEKYLDVEEAKGKLNIWIKEPRTVRWIARTFRRFLQNYWDTNND